MQAGDTHSKLLLVQRMLFSCAAAGSGSSCGYSHVDSGGDAAQVWGQSLRNVVAVEPSAEMTAVGRVVEAARGVTGDHQQRISWQAQLPDLLTASRSRRQYALHCRPFLQPCFRRGI